jgi:DNA-binding winged helix-turn-helix (wHTH) protein/TolB-like protein
VTYRFGLFEFDSGSGELRKSGRPVALEPQPSRALAVLLARADQLVTRDELKDAVWGKETHVDFDRGLAYCISQIRAALGDAGDSPRFVQTIPKKGYRFIAPVHAPLPDAEQPEAAEQTSEPAVDSAAAPLPHPWLGWRVGLAAALAALLGSLAVTVALRGPAGPENLRGGGGEEAETRAVVAVSVFDNETGLSEYDRLVSGLSDIVVTRLTGLAPDRIAVVGNAAVLRQPRNIRNLKAVADGVRADYVLLGQLQLDSPDQRADAGLRFITHFIRLRDETHLRANRLAFPNSDLTRLEQEVVEEFERAVRQHVLASK